MDCEQINLMISEYLDNELDKGKEGILFSHLSKCSECREEVETQNLIQNKIKLHQKEVSERFEEKIYSSIKNKMHVQAPVAKRAYIYSSYTLAFVVSVIALISFLMFSSIKSDLNKLEQKYGAAVERIQFQNQQLNLMMRNMPAVQITIPQTGM